MRRTTTRTVRLRSLGAVVALSLAGATLVAVPTASADTGDATAVTAAVQGLNIDVGWTADADPDVDAYVITTVPESPEVTVPGSARSTVLTGARPNVDYQVYVAAVRDGSSGDAIAADGSPRITAPGGSFVPLDPFRVVNTRTGLGVKAGTTKKVTAKVLGNQVPTTGVSAVVVDIGVSSTKAGSLTAYASGSRQPKTTTMSYAKSRNATNLAIVAVGTNGAIVLTSTQKAHLSLDITGYFTSSEAADPVVGLFNPIQAWRPMDTKNGTGASTPGPKEQVKVKIAGRNGVPETNVSAVVANVTVAGSSAKGSVTAYPTSGYLPPLPTVSFAKGQVVANRAIVPLGADGSISFYNSAGKTPLQVDVTGWFTSDDDPSASGSYYVPVAPVRLADTASGLGVRKGKLGAKKTLAVPASGRAGVPSVTVNTPATAVVTSVALVKPSATTTGVVFPSLNARPGTTDVSVAKNQTVANTSLSALGPDGKIAVYNRAGSTHVRVGLWGYFIGGIHVPESTVVARKGAVAEIEGDLAAGVTVTLAATAPTVEPGQVLVSGVSPATPEGLLARVVTVRTNGAGQQIAVTEPASLSDALGSADLSFSVPLTGTDVRGATGVARPRVNRGARPIGLDELTRRQSDPTRVTEDPVAVRRAKLQCSADAGSYVDASFSVVPTLNVETHVGWSGFHPTLRAQTYAQLQETATAGFGFKGQANCTWNQQLAKVFFPTITVPVAGVPVVISPQLTVTLKAGISGQAKISTSVTQQFTAKAGLEYDGDSVKPIKEVNNTFTYVPLSLTEANANASVALEAELIGKIYGIAGPTITLTAQLSADLDLLAAPWWKVVLDVTAKAGLKLDIWVFKFSVDTDDLTLYHKIIAQAGGNPTASTPVLLTFSEYPRYTTINTGYRSFGIDFSGDPDPYISGDGSNPTSPVLSGGTGFGAPLTGAFVNPDGSARTVAAFTVDVGYIDDPGSTEIVAYDSSGRLLQTAVANKLGIVTLTLSKPGIRFFTVRSTGVEGSGWAIDNLRFTGFSGQIQGKTPARAADPQQDASTRN